MQKFTVVGYYEESGQSVCEHVTANNGIHAFWVVAQARPDLSMVVAMPGHLTEGAGEVVFPGEGVVDADTILSQPAVFGPEDDTKKVLSIFEVDATTNEATGTVAPFCSEECRTKAEGTLGFAASKNGTSTLDDFGYTPHCEECGQEITG